MKRIIWPFVLAILFISTALSQTVYVTRTGTKYHSESCSYLRQSSIPISLQDAVTKGYTPCSRCQPPVLKEKIDRNSTNKIPMVNKKSSITQNTSERIGCICRDGNRSYATGRGACSHHGGVDHWLYKKK